MNQNAGQDHMDMVPENLNDEVTPGAASRSSQHEMVTQMRNL